jgi:hypothetical protein
MTDDDKIKAARKALRKIANMSEGVVKTTALDALTILGHREKFRQTTALDRRHVLERTDLSVIEVAAMLGLSENVVRKIRSDAWGRRL